MNNYSILDEQKIKRIDSLSPSKFKSDVAYKWFNLWNSDYLLKKRIYDTKILNELLGEDFAKIISLKSVENSLVIIDDELVELYHLEYEKINNLKCALISKNFKKENYKYYTPEDLIERNISFDYLYNINLLKKECINNNNFIEISKDLFKLLILDFFMGQWDRKNEENLLFEKEDKTNSPLLLAPAFDYGGSFNFSHLDLTLEKNGILYDIYKKDSLIQMNKYSNYFGNIIIPSEEFLIVLNKYKENINVVKSFVDLNIDEFFRNFEENRHISINDDMKSIYIYFCEQKQDILRKSLLK